MTLSDFQTKILNFYKEQWLYYANELSPTLVSSVKKLKESLNNGDIGPIYMNMQPIKNEMLDLIKKQSSLDYR